MEEKGLFYYYGAMSCGKSTSLLQTAFNYRERGYNVIVLTSALDDRYGTGRVTSRIGINSDAIIIPKDDLTVLSNIAIEILQQDIKAVFVDECQFMSKEQIDILGDIVDVFNIPVFCYGIKTDFESNLFTGSKRLFEIADSTEELKNICSCGKKAIFNARLTSSTEQVVIGGNDMYQSMCRHCYRNFMKNKA
jgi:thymidine kinase